MTETDKTKPKRPRWWGNLSVVGLLVMLPGGVVADNERTFVHSRDTDLLARREPNLESKARVAAERTVREAALEAGILDRACDNAQRTVTSFVRSLGYRDVTVTCAR
ncbi:MAG: DUF4230 domain-containing protein [Myxococcota bacterium]